MVIEQSNDPGLPTVERRHWLCVAQREAEASASPRQVAKRPVAIFPRQEAFRPSRPASQRGWFVLSISPLRWAGEATSLQGSALPVTVFRECPVQFGGAL